MQNIAPNAGRFLADMARLEWRVLALKFLAVALADLGCLHFNTVSYAVVKEQAKKRSVKTALQNLMPVVVRRALMNYTIRLLGCVNPLLCYLVICGVKLNTDEVAVEAFTSYASGAATHEWVEYRVAFVTPR